MTAAKWDAADKFNRPSVISASLADLVSRAAALSGDGQRRILGITGAPGAGKSTVCSALTAALGGRATAVGMDGFHLDNEELVRLSRRERKGAPDTFDVDGYVALLLRLRNNAGDVYAPRFDRAIEQSVGSAVLVPSDAPLVVTEGNYLLVDTGGWQHVRPLLDEVWYLDVPHARLESRLVARHRSYGKSPAAAEDWAKQVDLGNAALVESTRARADLVVDVLDNLHGDERTGGDSS